MAVNGRNYNVFPHLENMSEDTKDAFDPLMDKAFEARSIPIARRLVLKHYLEAIFENLKKDQITGKEI